MGLQIMTAEEVTGAGLGMGVRGCICPVLVTPGVYKPWADGSVSRASGRTTP